MGMAEERLGAMVGPVTMVVSGQGPLYEALLALCREVGETSELLELEAAEHPERDGLGPSLRLRDGWGRDTGVRFVGLPLGQEFAVLLSDLVDASRGTTGISPLGRSLARELKGELLVFWTPT